MRLLRRENPERFIRYEDALQDIPLFGNRAYGLCSRQKKNRALSQTFLPNMFQETIENPKTVLENPLLLPSILLLPFPCTFFPRPVWTNCRSFREKGRGFENVFPESLSLSRPLTKKWAFFFWNSKAGTSSSKVPDREKGDPIHSLSGTWTWMSGRSDAEHMISSPLEFIGNPFDMDPETVFRQETTDLVQMTGRNRPQFQQGKDPNVFGNPCKLPK